MIVKVNASSVNPVDWKVFESNAGLPIQFPHILGFDLAGIVVECPGCTILYTLTRTMSISFLLLHLAASSLKQ